MTQKTVLLAGFIGLVFGFLFAGTLGIDFFGGSNANIITDGLQQDEESFRLAYNLSESIYIPISGDDTYDKAENGDTFILYVGRETCPYCQQFVPVLMEAAVNLDVTEIYHVDSIDPLNSDFVDRENIEYTPSTFIFVDGVLVESIIGYRNLADTEQILSDALS